MGYIFDCEEAIKKPSSCALEGFRASFLQSYFCKKENNSGRTLTQCTPIKAIFIRSTIAVKMQTIFVPFRFEYAARKLNANTKVASRDRMNMNKASWGMKLDSIQY